VVLALLLNAVRLMPGEAIYLAAGNVHAYLGGLGVEIMANSDNVLRCGLTPKHVDVAELLAITDFTALAPPRFRPVGPSNALLFAPPVADFALTVFDLASAPARLAPAGPVIVLALTGRAVVEVEGARVELGAGRAVFVPAGVASFSARGDGIVAVAGVGGEI
jgi:mannose-6-phosphate isomerase